MAIPRSALDAATGRRAKVLGPIGGPVRHRLLLALLALLGACRPSRDEGIDLSLPGRWLLVGRTPRGVILAPSPAANDGRLPSDRGLRSQTATDTLTIRYLPGGTAARPLPARRVRLELPESAVHLTLGLATIDGSDHLFALPAESPLAIPYPGTRGSVLIEAANHLWRADPPGVLTRLTASQVAGFDRAQLAALQREGEVILYWAAVAVPSPDGRFVAYATNRESVRDRVNGQSIWVLDVTAGVERPLLAEARRAFRPVGWLGGEVVYTGDAPGVWAVDPRNGLTRQLASGFPLDVSGDGTTLLVADGVPDSTRIRIYRAGSWMDVPQPPDGLIWSGQGALSPAASKGLLQAANPAGTHRRFFEVDARGRVRPVELSGATLEDWPVWLDEERLLVSGGGRGDPQPLTFVHRLADP